MSERTWTVYGYRKDDSVAEQRRRGVPEWRLGQAVNWAVFRGFDTVLIELTPGVAASSSRQVTHHVCDDPQCPGGC